MKNLMVWIRIAVIVLLVCMFTGNITAETPILGKIFYPLFKPLVDEIVDIVTEREISGLMDFFAVFISLLLSLGMFTMKCRRIAQTDIKSDKLKLALIQANLYFNEDGRLVKKVEKLTGTDIDGDGEADTGTPTLTKGVIGGTIDAIREFFVIATTDLSDEEDYDKAVDDAGLKNASEALNELDKTTADGLFNLAADKTIEKLDKKSTEIDEDESLNKLQKIQRKSLMERFKEKIAAAKEKRKKAKEEKAAHVEAVEKAKKSEKVEVIANNVDEHSTEKPKRSLFGKKNKEEEIAKPAVAAQPTELSSKEKYLKQLGKK